MDRSSDLHNSAASDKLWKLTYKKFKPEEEKLREALTTLGNGYFGTRGAATEADAGDVHYPGNYIAGVFNTLPTKISGKTIYNEDMVNCPNWLVLKCKAGDEWFQTGVSKVLSYKKELDFKRGISTRDMQLEDASGKVVKITEERLVHMRWPHLAAISYSITPQNFEGTLVLRTGLDGTVENQGVDRYKDLSSDHLAGVDAGSSTTKGLYLHVRTTQSGIDIYQASRVRIFSGGKEKRPTPEVLTEGKSAVYHEYELDCAKGETLRVEKYLAQYTSRDKDKVDGPERAINAVNRKVTYFKQMAGEQARIWEELWHLHDIRVDGDDFATKVLRFHTFHLLQTACIHNDGIDNGFPARGLSGEAYRGHIFWDELFILPYFAIHLPETVRAILKYRYRRLDEARKYAAENGYEGAMFPWQSGAKGDEQTQIIHLNPMSGEWGPDYSRAQRHISLDIVYNFWLFWRKTEDHGFLSAYGAETILSVAKFASSLAKLDPADGRYHTEGLMGPDEFHEKMPGADEGGLTDNAYTNFLIVWTLLRAQEVINLVPDGHIQRLLKKLDISDDELQRWDDISRKMNIIFNDKGIISQFEGYFDLKELDWAHYRRKYGDIHRMDRILKAEGHSPDEYKVSKQADVLMIFYLLPLDEIYAIFDRLGYKFDDEMLHRNYEYYLTRTSHGSTLSKVVHCYVAHLLGLERSAEKWFRSVLMSDINDTQGGTTPEGIHCGVMGGSLDLVLRGFAGIHTPADGIVRIKPDIPASWEAVDLRFLYRGDMVHANISNTKVRLFIEPKDARFPELEINIAGVLHKLTAGREYSFDI